MNSIRQVQDLRGNPSIKTIVKRYQDDLVILDNAMRVPYGSSRANDIENHIFENHTEWLGGVDRPSGFPETRKAILGMMSKYPGTSLVSNQQLQNIVYPESFPGVSHGVATVLGDYFFYWDNFQFGINEPCGPIPEPSSILSLHEGCSLVDLFKEDTPFLECGYDISFEWSIGTATDRNVPYRPHGLPTKVSVRDTEWWHGGVYHRTDGPAKITADEDEKCWTLMYAIDGDIMSKEQFVRWYEMNYLEEYTRL